jgi:pimeloyl-ACP methyl ester carboxylesterase
MIAQFFRAIKRSRRYAVQGLVAQPYLRQGPSMTDFAQIRAELSSVPEVPKGSAETGLLVPYGGERPVYPDWVLAALNEKPTRSKLDVDGAQIEVLSWGKQGDPAVLLLHGNGASADWWSFIAPQLAASGKHVVAMSFSGMGGSDWRETYQMDSFVAEILAVIEAMGLHKPILAGHSFGGFPALITAINHGDKVSALIMLDSSIEPPGEEWTGPPKRTAPNRVYPTLQDGLARFRLAPPQPCDNHWALDYIARASLKPVEGGWTWRFDPFLWNSFAFTSVSHLTLDLKVPTIVMRGGLSYLMADRIFDYMKSIMPPATQFVTIEGANHHVMLDQPLATLAALEAAIAGMTILPKPATRV